MQNLAKCAEVRVCVCFNRRSETYLRISMLLHGQRDMCVGKRTRLNPQQQTPNKDTKPNTTNRTPRRHRHHPGGGGHTNGVKKTHAYSQSDVKRVRAHHLGLPNDTTLKIESIIKGICCCCSCCSATHNVVSGHQTYWKPHDNLGSISSNYHWIPLRAALPNGSVWPGCKRRKDWQPRPAAGDNTHVYMHTDYVHTVSHD